jgi:mono/diheme cytochrome c family protein
MPRRPAALPAAALSLAAAIVAALAVGAAGPVEMPQGWTDTEREIWWNSPQGSRIVPYDWFLKLEQPDSTEPFAAPAFMAGFGYLPSSRNAMNPDGLPIGFSRERDRADGLWLGMTCAACHVGQLTRNGTTLLVEGAGSMADTRRFDMTLTAAMVATQADPAKYDRLVAALGVLENDKPAMRARFDKVVAERVGYTRMNAPPHPPGPGRVDALGVIMNQLAAAAIDKPGNARAPDAPVRLPWIWGSSFYSRVQYNGSISNAGLGPVLRNIGQTLGVYGAVDVSTPGMSYPSSVSVADLEKLEALLRRLDPPKWDEAVLGPIDRAKAERGAPVFQQTCAGCHTVRERDVNGLVPMTLVPLNELGTDPTAARNFMTRPAETGMLEGRPVGVFGGPAFGPRAPAAAVVGHVSTAVAAQLPPQRLQAGLAAYRAAVIASPPRLDAYKAVPLAGAWAGAPYLHNGSVASLRELLTPPGQRAVRFTYAGRDYDPAVVGFPADVAGDGFVLDTTVPGNANTGHEYGTTLPEADKAALLEYLKTL